jgi:competence protein ComEA
MDIETDNKFDKYRIPIGLSLVGLVLIIGGMFTTKISKNESRSEVVFPEESLLSTDILVDVSGAVNNPGVYKLIEGARVEDAIKIAGGLSKDVNNEYISKSLNMAQKISDGTKLYIPYDGEAGIGGVGEQSGAGVVAGTVASAQININTSTQTELESLPGIGPVTASKIISSRPYQKIENLLEKKIIGKSVFEKIKSFIVVY